MSFLVITIPVTLLVASTLLFLVVRAARRGEFEDPEAPATRMLFDDDHCPEHPSSLDGDLPSMPDERPIC